MSAQKDYPNAVRWSGAAHEREVIEDFISWCSNKKDLVLARWHADSTMAYFSGSFQDLLMEYFEVNPEKHELELREMVKEIEDAATATE